MVEYQGPFNSIPLPILYEIFSGLSHTMTCNITAAALRFGELSSALSSDCSNVENHVFYSSFQFIINTKGFVYDRVLPRQRLQSVEYVVADMIDRAQVAQISNPTQQTVAIPFSVKHTQKREPQRPATLPRREARRSNGPESNQGYRLRLGRNPLLRPVLSSAEILHLDQKSSNGKPRALGPSAADVGRGHD